MKGGVSPSCLTVLTVATLFASVVRTVTAQGETIVNGKIEFGPLPSRSPPLSSATYDDGGLQPLVDVANSFVKTVKSDGPPYGESDAREEALSPIGILEFVVSSRRLSFPGKPAVQ